MTVYPWMMPASLLPVILHRRVIEPYPTIIHNPLLCLLGSCMAAKNELAKDGTTRRTPFCIRMDLSCKLCTWEGEQVPEIMMGEVGDSKLGIEMGRVPAVDFPLVVVLGLRLRRCLTSALADIRLRRPILEC